jgi:hypothetical protein
MDFYFGKYNSSNNTFKKILGPFGSMNKVEDSTTDDGFIATVIEGQVKSIHKKDGGRVNIVDLDSVVTLLS